MFSYRGHLGDEKLRHSSSVASLMYERALELTGDAVFADDMFLLGFLHDIGYIYGGEGHADSGAALLARNGYRFVNAVRNQSDALVDGDDSLPDILLKWCDMSVLPNGEVVSISERLHDIENRYDEGSDVISAARKTAKWLFRHLPKRYLTDEESASAER